MYEIIDTIMGEKDGILTLASGKQVKGCGKAGERIHGFCEENEVIEQIPLSDVIKDGEDLKEHIDCKKIPGLSGADLDKDTLTGILCGADMSDILSEEETDEIYWYLENYRQLNQTYLSFKRQCLFLPWGVFYRGAKATSLNIMNKHPYIFFISGGASFSEADKYALTIGYPASGEDRMLAFIRDLFTNGQLKRSTCCPVQVLIGCITKGLNLNEQMANDFLTTTLEDGVLIKDADKNDVYIFTKSAYLEEIKLAEDIKKAAARHLSVPGVKKGMNEAGINKDYEGLITCAAKNAVCAILTDDIDKTKKILTDFFTTRPLEDKTVKIRAGGLSEEEFKRIFDEVKAKEKLIFISEKKEPDGDIQGRVFSDMIDASACGVADIRDPGIKDEPDKTRFSMLKTFLLR